MGGPRSAPTYRVRDGQPGGRYVWKRVESLNVGTRQCSAQSDRD